MEEGVPAWKRAGFNSQASYLYMVRQADLQGARGPQEPPGAGAQREGQRKARLQNYFNRQDEFWAFREWPLWVQQIALQAHKRFRERYRLFLFFVWNGLNPLTARMWVIIRDYKGRFIEEEYDRSAWSQLDQMVKDAFNKELYKPETKMFDMITGRPEIYSAELK